MRLAKARLANKKKAPATPPTSGGGFIPGQPDAEPDANACPRCGKPLGHSRYRVCKTCVTECRRQDGAYEMGSFAHNDAGSFL